jgi:hypothetical protein
MTIRYLLIALAVIVVLTLAILFVREPRVSTKNVPGGPVTVLTEPTRHDVPSTMLQNGVNVLQ